MQSHLFVGGSWDGLNVPVAPDVGAVQLRTDDAEIENYIRETLTVGDVYIIIYRHESLTPEQVLSRLVQYYEAWAASRSGGRL